MTQWKVIYGVDSYVEKNVKNTETSKELNQVELMKQFIGTWKAEIGKDTIAYFDQKTYGTGQEVFIKALLQRENDCEGKQLWGYDKKLIKSFNRI